MTVRMNKRSLLLGLLLLSTAALADDNLQCANGIVARGSSSDQAVAACGLPTLKESITASPLGASYDEEWYYNFGARQLLRIVRLRQGRVTGIEDDGYGFQNLPKLSCDFYSLKEKLSKLRLILACGKPSRRETLVVYRSQGLNLPENAMRPILRERWHYNSDAGERVRTVTLENGRISYVEEKQTPAAR